MPIPEDRLYSPSKTNLWFAASSVVMTLSILWLIQVDYRRPWHAYQDNISLGKAALAHLDYLDALRTERQAEIAEAGQRLADLRAYADQTSGPQRRQLETDLATAQLEFKKVNDPWSRVSQVLDVTRDTYERTLGAYGADHSSTRQAHATLREQEENEEELRKQKEYWEDETKRLQAALRDLEKPVREAEKRLRDLEAAAEAARAKDQQYRGVYSDEGLLAGLPIIRTIINMPILDFAAPKNTPARRQVNQLVLPDVRQRLNYLESYTTDRCTTCHAAIDDPQFSKDRLARQLERSLPGINEARARMAKPAFEYPPPPELGGNLPPPPVGQVTDHWGELTREQQDAYFDALLALVNRYLSESGRKTIDLGQPLLAHPDLDLFVTVDSPHPMAKVGCTVCHEGNSQETDFVLAAHTPPTHDVEEHWAEEYYTRRLGMPLHTFETVEHYWDRPMRLPRYTEAGCAKCHSQITDIARYHGERKGARLNLGRYLFTNVGCINCHNVDALAGSRRVAPDLSYVAHKLTPGFVEQWAFSPQSFRPSTRMPHFFMQENNRPQSANTFDPDPLLRTETEVAAITRYLFAVSKDWQPLEKPAEIEGDVERGRALFKKVGCLGCHGNIAEFGEEWITRDLVERADMDEETARFRYKGMTYEERVRYAMTHFTNERDTFLDPEHARFVPGREGYQPPVWTRFAPELSGIGSKVSFPWLYSWLMEPTHYAPDTLMPSLRLSPTEAADLAAYLLTLRYDGFAQNEFEMNEDRMRMADELIFTLLSAQRSERHSRAVMADEGGELSAMLLGQLAESLGRSRVEELVASWSPADKRLIFLGNKMIAHYGCYACHNIPGFEKTTPPGTDLSTWAEKPVTQLDFAFYDNAFHHVREEKPDIYSYIYPRDADTLNALSPIDDLAKEQITHTHAAFARHKMLNPRLWDREKIKRPYDKLKMPNFYFTEKEADALTTYLLSRVPPRVNDVLKIKYATTSAGPIAAGRDLTRELNCIGCHQIEDNAPTVQQYFQRTMSGKPTFDTVNAPPLLRGEGAKVQHHWFHRFLQHVEPLRPWLQVRMPSFTLTGEQATTLVEYFAALSQQDSRDLAELLRRVDEHFAKVGEQAGSEAADTATREAWYERDSLKDEAIALRRWALERELMRPHELDPLLAPPDRLAAGHEKLLERTRFMQRLYNVEYPFVEPPKPLSPAERFATGRSFFNDMGCLKCHVLGRMLAGPPQTTDDFVQMFRLDGVRGEGSDVVAVLNGEVYPPGATIDGFTLVSAENVFYDTGDVETKATVEGPNPAGESERIMLQAPSAPNLSLTHQRLRREWVVQWMLEPGWIQPGTKMPQNFPKTQSPFEGDPKYPGTGMDHIHLLVDYLYDAGTVGDRAPLPKIVASPPEEFDEEGGAAEEFLEE